MIKGLQRFTLLFICFLLVVGTGWAHEGMAASPQQPGDERSVIPNEPLTGAAYGNGIYVAVGYYGKIVKSANGLNWQIAADRTRLDVHYTGIAFGGNQFVAVGDQGTIMTSSDGNVWTQRDSTVSTRIDRVAYAALNGINKFYAVTTAGKVLSSTDGAIWTAITIGTGSNLTSIAVSSTAIVIGDASGYVHTSSNGTSWSHKKLDETFFINSVLSLNNRFYANDALGWIYTSENGYDWWRMGTPFKTTSASTPNQIFGGLYDGTTYFLFGYDGSSYGGIFTSTNGVSFQQQTKGSTMTSQNAFYANDVYMQLGNDGMVVSTDGIVWQYPYGGSHTSVMYDGTRYIAVGKNGSDGFIKRSSDALNWTKVNSQLLPALQSIAYGNGNYVAVSNSSGSVLTSNDAVNWTVNAGAVKKYGLTSIVYGDGVFVGVSKIGSIYKSTNNGVTWTLVKEDPANFYPLHAVSYANGIFYAAGDDYSNPFYLKSEDAGATWTSVDADLVRTAASFNIHAFQQADIPVNLTLNNNTLKSISVSNVGSLLSPGTDYTVLENTVTLKKEFLSQLAEGWQIFTIHLSDGVSQTFAVRVTNSSLPLAKPTNLTLSPAGVAQWENVASTSYEVQLYRNGSVWGSVVKVANVTNTNFLTAMRAAGPGKYTFKVKAEGNTIHSKDGQQSDASNIIEIYKAPTEDGSANKAGTSQKGSFPIVVNAVNGAAVTAKAGGANVLTAVESVPSVNGKAALPVDISRLSEGANEIVIAYTTADGSFSEELKVSVTKDTIAPDVPTEDAAAPIAGTIQNTNFNVIVHTESGAKVTARIGAVNVLQAGAGTEVTAVSGKAMLPIDLAKLSENDNQIAIVATDGAGNVSGTLTVPVKKDTIAPAAPAEDGSANKHNTTQMSDFTIIVTAENESLVTAKIGGTNVLVSGSNVTAANNKAELPIDLTKLTEGLNAVDIIASDAVGNTSGSLTVSVTKDTTAPNRPAEDGSADKAGTIQNANFDIVVNAETGSAVTAKVNGTNVLVSGTDVTAANNKAALSIDLSKLTEGSNGIDIIATDAVGHASTALTVTVTKDTSPPGVPAEDGTADKAGTTQNVNFSILVNAETGAAVTAKVGAANVLASGTEVTASGNKATLLIDAAKLAEGLNAIEIVATDSLGVASGTLTVAVTKDTSPPAVPAEDGTADKAGTTQTANFTIIVDAEAGAAVTAKTGGSNVLQSVSSVIAVAGKAVLPIDLSKLAMGSNDLVIIAADAIGNESGALTITINRAESSNADLSSLSVSTGALNEAFDAATVVYTQSVANSTESVTITPAAADSQASVTVNDTPLLSGQTSLPIALQVGVNRIEVVVAAANQSRKTYTIVITRISNHALLSSLSVDEGILTPVFSTTQLDYRVDVPNTVSSLHLFLVKGDLHETITVTGATYTSVTGDVYAYSASNLGVGSNLISLLITAQDGTTTNAYTVTVDRAPLPSSNADLNGLTMSSGFLTPVFTSGQMSYTSNVANEVAEITVTASAADNQAALTINGTPANSGLASGAIPLQVGPNTVTIVVTAQNGAIKTYTVNVNRAAQEDDGDDDGGSGSVPSTPSWPTDGRLMLPAGQAGEVSLGDAVKISIPAGATEQEMKLTIEQLKDAQNLIKNGEVLVSPIFELLKNFTGNFKKPITLTFAFNRTVLSKEQQAAVYYFDEEKKSWMEVPGGQVSGDRISVEVDHFTKFAVFAVSPSEPTKEPFFIDTARHWAEISIQQAVSSGIVSGYPDGRFMPDRTVSRAEFAVMLMNALKLQGEGAALTFTDKAQIGAWAQKAVALAVEAGVIHGYEDGSFRPEAEITRAEMAVILANALGATSPSSAAPGFADDSTIPSWAISSVAFMQQAGIMQGKGNHAFAPQDKATRAEAVVVLLKAAEHMRK